MEPYIRRALPSDLDALCALAERFVGETALPLTFDPELTRETLWRGIHHGIMLVADQGVIAGAVMGHVDMDFCKEPIAFMGKFYVEKEFRGVGISRALVKAFDEEAFRQGAKLVFTSATAGMGDRVEKLYTRLFEKQGYEVLGRVLVKCQK